MMSLYETILENWTKNVKTEKELIKYMDDFQLIYSYNSGKIENPQINFDDTREIFENDKVVSFTGDLKTFYEIKNLKDCLGLMVAGISSRKRIDIDLIKKFHFMLTKYTYDERTLIDNEERPGEFKNHDYITGLYEIGAAPDEVVQELSELTGEIADEFSLENVIAAGSYFHLKFENIRPFADGNGRTGRTLLNYFLMLNDHPPVCIYDEDKILYMNALIAYDKSGDIEPMVDFLKKQVEKTWQKTPSLTSPFTPFSCQ